MRAGRRLTGLCHGAEGQEAQQHDGDRLRSLDAHRRRDQRAGRGIRGGRGVWEGVSGNETEAGLGDWRVGVRGGGRAHLTHGCRRAVDEGGGRGVEETVREK